MTPLERAARAVEDHLSDAFFDGRQPNPFKIARAVLMAVREMPAATQAAIFDERDGFVQKIDIPAVWQLGIDAILADLPKGDE